MTARPLLHPSSLALALAAALLALAAPVAAEQPVAKKPTPAPPVPAAIAARLPADGYLIAHVTDRGTDDWFGLTRVGRTGVTELHRDKALPDEAAWLDARTLVTITTDEHSATTLRRYVDGKPAGGATTVPATAWTFPRGKTMDDARAPELWLGKGGAVWLTRCHTLTMKDIDEVCTASAWLRVDGPFTAAKKKPPGVRRAGAAVPSVDNGGALPKGVKAPAGYAVKLRKITVDGEGGAETVKGFECAGGGGTQRWPTRDVTDWQFNVRPTKVTWVSTKPPMFAIAGKATNPIGQVSNEVRVFRACQPKAIGDFIWLGDNRWAEMEAHWNGDTFAGTTWTLRVDDVPVAVLSASPYWFLLAPPP